MTSRKQRRAPQKRAPSAATTRSVALPLPRGSWWVALALVVATMLAYIPALDAPFVLDDWVTIDASSRWESAAGMPTAGRPLVMATLAANYEVNRLLGVNQQPDPDGPNKAIGYRLFNVLLHLLTGALLFAVLRRAIRERPIPQDWREIADPLAGVVTALWLLHPIQSEVINYVVQRSEGLASLCYLAVLYASQRAWDAAPSSRARWFALAVVACVLGMLSKEIVISAPLAVMLYDRAFRQPSWRALWRPANGRAFLYAALWTSCLATFALVALGTRGGSPDLNEGVSWYGYFYTQCWAIAHYLRLAVWPNALSTDYGFRTIHGARGIPGLALLSAFGVATIIAWTRVERLGWFAFLGSMFFILLAPSSSVVPVVLEVAAERRIYLALAVVLVLAVVGVEWLRRRAAARLQSRWAVAGAAGIAIALAITTAVRSRTYSNPEALWRGAVQAVPENSRALEQLGLTLLTLQPPKRAEAESAFVKALARDSSCQSGCLQYGTLLSKEGRFAEAIPLLERQSAQGAGTRYNVLAMQLLALDLMELGDYNRAIPYLERLVQVDPKLSHFVALGVAYLSVGRREEAIATFRFMATFDLGDAKLQQLSRRLEDGVSHPEALLNLQEFAFSMARGWM
jgi:Tfp pilus assembly protein PilF